MEEDTPPAAGASDESGFFGALGEQVGRFLAELPGGIVDFFGGVGRGAGVSGFVDWADGDGAPADSAGATLIQGGRERGLILHKLIEEVLTGETAESLPDLRARAEVLTRELGSP